MNRVLNCWPWVRSLIHSPDAVNHLSATAGATDEGLRQTKLRGLPKVDWAFTFAAAAYNLVRAPKLRGAAA